MTIYFDKLKHESNTDDRNIHQVRMSLITTVLNYHGKYRNLQWSNFFPLTVNFPTKSEVKHSRLSLSPNLVL